VAYSRRLGKGKGRAVAPLDEPTDAQIAKFLGTLESSFEPSIVEAGKAAGINRKQYESLLAKNKAFAAQIQEWADTQRDQIEERARQLALKGDPSMIRFILQSEMPEKYGNKGKLDITHRITSPEDLKQLTDEELEQLANGNGD
jgi:hypothetical protein